MTSPAPVSISEVVARLAALDVDSWRGLPVDLAWPAADGDALGASSLGDTLEPADVASIATPPAATGARAWLRDEYVVLIDVALDVAVGPAPPEGLGAPERRLDVTYGLQHLASGEWVYPERGLALVVDDERVRHVMGFVACDAVEYEARLRVPFATTRRPLDGRHVKEGL